MKLREVFLAMNLFAVFAIITLGQNFEARKKPTPDEILNRRVAECFTQVQSDDPDECVHIGNTTMGKLLIDSLSWQRESIPVGIALSANDDGLSRLNFKPSSLSVRDILNSIVSADPRYKWNLENGVINLLPAVGNPSLLDTRLAEFKKENAMTESLFKSLENMPEVRQRATELGMDGPLPRLFRFGSVDTRKFTVHCQNCSVRDVLNEIVRQNGSSWMYREYINKGKKTYRFWYISP